MQPAISNYFASRPRTPKRPRVDPSTETQQPSGRSTENDQAAAPAHLPSLTRGSYEGIDWTRLRGFEIPPQSDRARRSRVWDYGWLIHNPRDGEDGIDYWLCKICHLRDPKPQRPTNHILQATSSTSSSIAHLRNQHGVVINSERPVELPPAPMQPSDPPTARPTMDELLAARANGGPWDPDTFLQLLLKFFVAEKLPWKEVESPYFRDFLILSNPECEQHIPSAQQLEELHKRQQEPAPAPPTTEQLLAARAQGGPFDADTFLHLLVRLFAIEKIPWKEVESAAFRKLLVVSNPQSERYIPSAKRLQELHEVHGLEPFSGEA